MGSRVSGIAAGVRRGWPLGLVLSLGVAWGLAPVPAGSEVGPKPDARKALVAEGRIWPQSRGSQLAGLVVGAREGERTLDLCAAPGGKATQLGGDVTAVEKHPGRARELVENAARLGASNVSVVCADALELPPELRD